MKDMTLFHAFSFNYFRRNIAHKTSRLTHTIAEGNSLFIVMDHFDSGCKVSACFSSPPPTDEMEFATLWCRSIKFSVKHWSVSLRDFPQPMIDITNMHVWGRLIGAEREGTKRGTCCVLKFYRGMGGHELECDGVTTLYMQSLDGVLPCRMG